MNDAIINFEKYSFGDETFRRRLSGVWSDHRISIPLRYRTTMMVVRRSKKEMSLIFKNDARSLARRVTMLLSFKNLLTRR
jgi:hypothetical protein